MPKIANIHYFEFTSNYETKEASHAFRELVYVDSGSLNVHSESFTGTLELGELIIHRKNEMHALRCPDGVAPNVVIIGFECDEKKLDRFAFAPVKLSSDLAGILSEIIFEGRNVFLPPYDVPNLTDMKKRPNAQYGADQLLQSSLETFLIKLIRGTNFSDDSAEKQMYSPFVNSVVSYIERNYRERIRIDELTFLFNTNRTTLCCAFHSQTGETISKFINRLRIKHAKELIREGKMNFSEIAEELNFPSQAYFNRVFVKAEGMTPGQYIHNIRSILEFKK